VVQVLCGLGLVDCGPLGGELAGGEVTVGGVGPVPVVVTHSSALGHWFPRRPHARSGSTRYARSVSAGGVLLARMAGMRPTSMVIWCRTWLSPFGAACSAGADSGKDQGDWLTDSRTSRARDLSSLRTCEYLARSSGACSRPAFSYAAYIDARVSSSRSRSRQRASTVAA
jgi:hypothetical protein